MPYRVELERRPHNLGMPTVLVYPDAVPCKDPGQPFTILKAHISFTRFTNFNRSLQSAHDMYRNDHFINIANT